MLENIYTLGTQKWREWVTKNISGISGIFNIADDSKTIKPNVVEYQPNPTTPTTQGSQYWDSAFKVLSTVLGDGVVIQNGLEMYVRVVNKTGVKLDDGKVVYISGAQGNRPKATLAIATTNTTANVIGVTTQDIAINGEGFVTVFGDVSNFNTNGYVDGADMYLSSTTAGELTSVSPEYPNHKVCVATSLNSTNNGKIFVRPTHVYELAELHGVDLTDTLMTDTDAALIQTSTGVIKKSLLGTLKTALVDMVNLNISNRFQILSNKYSYSCGSTASDTVGDIRRYSNSGVLVHEICTVANATKGAGTWVNTYSIDVDGFMLDQYDDILPSMGWIDAAASAAPDIVTHTIGGIAVNFKAFDGGNTEEAMTNSVEITHAINIAALNRITSPISAEIHTHGMPSTTGSGVVKIFYDLVYQPAPIAGVSQPPIVWGTFSNLITFADLNALLILIGFPYISLNGSSTLVTKSCNFCNCSSFGTFSNPVLVCINSFNVKYLELIFISISI